MIQRVNDHPVFRIYKNFEVLHIVKKKKVLVCDICTGSFATLLLNRI